MADAIIAVKHCSRCGSTKSVDKFPKDKRRRDGLFPWCKQCKCEDERVRRNANLDEYRRRDRKRRAENVGHYRRIERKAQAKRRSKPGYKKLQRKWSQDKERKRHRERAAVVSCPVCGVEHSPLFGQWRSVCSDECSDIHYKRIRSRKAIKRKALVRGSSAAIVIDPFKVFKAYKWTCAYCGCDTPQDLRGSYENNAPELDHVVPVIKGGPHTYANVQLLCRSCNGVKSAHIVQRCVMVKAPALALLQKEYGNVNENKGVRGTA